MNETNKIVARFAPSPTGYLHIGGARTCLFSWLYARRNNGKFILRIEDTDLQRSKKEYHDEILESIRWLGMDWDEIYYQSQRFDLYHQYAQKLIDQGNAYRKDGAVFFKYEFNQVELDDSIRGKIIFNELPKEEEVIIKSDNSPTYNFCCVIDDSLMGINCVIRGEDHISNTPKQLLMYKALGFTPPRFAHVPLILSPDGGRLSKRFGATSIREYKMDGFLSEGIANYLLLLGWAPGNNREIISLNEARQMFDIKDVNKTGAAFSIDKLTWVNTEYLKIKTIPELTALVQDYFSFRTPPFPLPEKEYLEKVVELFKKRVNRLSDFIDWAQFCFSDEYEYNEEAKKILERDYTKEINALIEAFRPIDDFKTIVLEEAFRRLTDSLGIKVKELVHPVRVALTGRKVGPGLFESMEVLGKEKVLARLERLLKYWQKTENSETV